MRQLAVVGRRRRLVGGSACAGIEVQLVEELRRVQQRWEGGWR